MERAQVRRQVTDKAVEEERTRHSQQNPVAGQGKQSDPAVSADRNAQPSDKRMGKLSPLRGRRESIRPSPLRNLELSVAMGTATSSTQRQEMVIQTILDYLAQAVGVRDAGARCQGRAPMGQTD